MWMEFALGGYMRRMCLFRGSSHSLMATHEQRQKDTELATLRTKVATLPYSLY